MSPSAPRKRLAAGRGTVGAQCTAARSDGPRYRWHWSGRPSWKGAPGAKDSATEGPRGEALDRHPWKLPGGWSFRGGGKGSPPASYGLGFGWGVAASLAVTLETTLETGSSC